MRMQTDLKRLRHPQPIVDVRAVCHFKVRSSELEAIRPSAQSAVNPQVHIENCTPR